MRKFEITNEKVSKVAKIACMFYCIYCVCYIVGGTVTMVVLYKDQIITFIKKVMMAYKRIIISMICFFKRMRNKLHPQNNVDKEWLKEAIKYAPVVNMDDLEFACSEE